MAGSSRALAEALRLALPTFPCRADKAPACPRGFLAATAEPAALRDLWRRYPGPLVGVPMGGASGLDALDIDAPRHSEAADWWARHHCQLPATRTHQTRSGGCHVLFRHRVGLRCWTGHPVPGIDGRADGGYVVWWPAEGEPVLCKEPPAPWPAWLLDELTPPPTRPAWTPTTDWSSLKYSSRYASAALRHASDRVARAPTGARNRTLNSEAFSLARLVVAGSLDSQDVADTLAAAALAAGLPPLEILTTLRSAFGARGPA